MLGLRYSQHQRTACCRVVGVLLLAFALVAPKLSLSASMLLGNGYRTVVICTGTQLARVTVSPAGEIVKDLSDLWVAPHCVLSDHDVVILERAWYLSGYRRLFAVTDVPLAPIMPLQRSIGTALSSRGPPRA